jgi:hypothetical protein
MRATSTAATATPCTSATEMADHDRTNQASSALTTVSPTANATGATTATPRLARSRTSGAVARCPARDRMIRVLPAPKATIDSTTEASHTPRAQSRSSLLSVSRAAQPRTVIP